MTNNNLLPSGNYGNSLNLFIYNMIPNSSVCLDVGCWTGNLGEKLINEKKCIVDGIDANDQVLKIAKQRGYKSTYLINLNNDQINLDQIAKKYDIIIFADILEHLIHPEYILKTLNKNLKPEGKILVSLPNVAFILNRFELMMGRWTYREFGTLDKTHLRFYTIRSIADLIEKAGYSVIKIKPYNQFGILRYMEPFTKLFPSLFAYQTLVVAQPK